MLEVTDLAFDYPDRAILRNVNFTLAAGSLLHLRGANGAGKTTLLKLLAGILTPLRGEIYFQKTSIHTGLDQYYNQINYVGHRLGFNPVLTVKEHCQYALGGISPIELIGTFSLLPQQDTPCGLLSMGQKRRVSLMRLLTKKSLLWLLDEPFSGLDQEGTECLVKLLQYHLTQGGQVVLSSHQGLPLQLPYHEYFI